METGIFAGMISEVPENITRLLWMPIEGKASNQAAPHQQRSVAGWARAKQKKGGEGEGYGHTHSKGREFAIIGLKLVLLSPRRNDEI